MDSPERNALAGLPDEAMLEILARVPFRSVCRSKCVAKAWRDLIDDPLNRGRLPQTLEGFLSIFYPSPDSDIEHFFVKYSASSVPLDLDPCFSFLAKLPEIESLYFVDSCNGLLLFKHTRELNGLDVGYIVCNPTTKRWATVPVCACCLSSNARFQSDTYLAFDPAVSSHFHLIHFWKEGSGEKNPLGIEKLALSVSTYSSETGVWSHSQTDWNDQGQLEGWRRQYRINFWFNQRTFVNGLLHLMVSDWDLGLDQIVAVDVQGRTKRTIETPAAAQGRPRSTASYIGQSQGCLHYISQELDSHLDFRQEQDYEVSIWALQDHDTQEWVLKDTMSRRMIGRWDFLVIHPDRNVVFLLQLLDRLIVAYDMDSKELSVVATLSEKLVGLFVPYIPCFLESPALTNKN